MNWIYYVRYDGTTGAVLAVGKMQEEVYEHHLAVEPGHYLVSEEPVSIELLFDHYVDVKTKTMKPKTPMPIKVDGLVVSGIPKGTAAEIQDATYTVNDGTLDLTFDLPGEHTITLSHPQHVLTNVKVVQP